MYADKYAGQRKDVNFMKKYSKAVNAASGSEVDANANVANKNIATMAPEIHKKENIYANRLAMHDKITEMYGVELAEEYVRQLEAHEIYRHDESGMPVGTPYCCSITLYPFLLHGLKQLGGTSEAPKNLDSFCGGFINLVFAVAAQFAGATATPEFLSYLSYFLAKEYGEDYHKRADEVVDLSLRRRTIRDIVHAKFQQIVYSINQPAAARGSQSVFWNIAYFDKPYFMSLFDGFVFPDGTFMVDLWEGVRWIQREFMMWFNEERRKKVLTFPVESFSLLNDGKDYVDKDAAEWVAEMYAKGHSFFTYTSDSVDSLASCCYSGDTKVIIKDANGAYLVPISEIKNMKFNPNGYRVFNNGKWSAGKFVELPARKMYKVTTSNGKTMVLTDNHRNNCLGGMKLTSELTCEDYLMFNSAACDTYPEKNEGLTYEQGFAVGAFLGDGSFGGDVELASGETCIYETNYSLCEKKRWIIDLINKAAEQMGVETRCTIGKEYNSVLPAKISSKDFVAMIIRWTNWKRGVSAANKELNMDCLLQSIPFRQGILDGWVATDGNKNSCTSGGLRGYTSSKKLFECMEALCTSLGIITSNIVDERTEPPVFRGVAYNKNHPVYGLTIHERNKQARLVKDRAVFRDNSYYMRITSIEEVEYDDPHVYCFEMENKDDDKFTLANGIHNYNCRLRNGMEENTFSYSLGAGGIATGSKCVMTININRLVQDAVRDGADISQRVREQVEKIHKYLTAFNEIVKEKVDEHMLPVYEAGYVTPEKQYLTVGINGFNEGAEFLGIEISDNEAYQNYAEMILRPIYELDKADRTDEIMWNMELVPAENLGGFTPL